MKVWIDIKNSHEPLFFKSIISELDEHEFIFTARDYIEVTKLLRKYNYTFITVGKHHGKKLVLKLYGLLRRELGLFLRVGKFDVALSHGSAHSVHVAFLKNRKSIHIYDNDLPTFSSRLSLPILNYLIIPASIDPGKFKRFSKKTKIFHFNGFKEDIYLADFQPDPDFLKNIPFEDFVAVRPEALKAEYVPKDAESLIPHLLQSLGRGGINVLYLPRYEEDKIWAQGMENIFIPSEPLNGLDVCYYARAVLTGSGTIAREAAAMGKPAISFYPGRELLSVDEDMIRRGWLMHSRKPEDIIEYVKQTKPRQIDRQRSKRVKREVIGLLREIFLELSR